MAICICSLRVMLILISRAVDFSLFFGDLVQSACDLHLRYFQTVSDQI
jgi:hypothetical protein